MNIRWLVLPAALLCFQAVATAQDTSPQGSQEEPLAQVDVEAERARLHAMEAQLYAFEDQFFSGYNDVNDIHAYEVHCGWEMRRQFRVHRCKPVFQEWSERGGAEFLTHSGSTGFSWAGNEDPNSILLRTRAYQKHMTALVAQHPELLKVLQDRAELGARYKELRKKLKWD